MPDLKQYSRWGSWDAYLINESEKFITVFFPQYTDKHLKIEKSEDKYICGLNYHISSEYGIGLRLDFNESNSIFISTNLKIINLQKSFDSNAILSSDIANFNIKQDNSKISINGDMIENAKLESINAKGALLICEKNDCNIFLYFSFSKKTIINIKLDGHNAIRGKIGQKELVLIFHKNGMQIPYFFKEKKLYKHECEYQSNIFPVYDKENISLITKDSKKGFSILNDKFIPFKGNGLFCSSVEVISYKNIYTKGLFLKSYYEVENNKYSDILKTPQKFKSVYNTPKAMI